MDRPAPGLLSVMTPFPHSIPHHARPDAARRMMDRHGVRHLPVMRDGRVFGVLSSRDLDLVRAVLAEGILAEKPRIGLICSAPAYVVDCHERLEVVLREMNDRRIGSAVVTREGKLVGIFTSTDAIGTLADLLGELAPEPGPDATA